MFLRKNFLNNPDIDKYRRNKYNDRICYKLNKK